MVETNAEASMELKNQNLEQQQPQQLKVEKRNK
jgi:hypothetical protein